MKAFLINHGIIFLAGGIYAMAYPSELGAGWFPLIFIAIPLFLWFLENSSFKESLSLILAYNLGLNVFGYYWIPHTLREFGQLPWIVSIFLGLFFSLILQPHWWLYAVSRKYRPKRNWADETGVISLAFLMTVLERYFPQQFPSYVGSPWFHLAPYLSLAPIMGVAVFSFMTYWVSLEVVAQLRLKTFRPLVWIVLVIFIVVNAAFPLKVPNFEKALNVRIVQANIGNFLKIQSEKGDSDSYESVAKKYERLSTETSAFKLKPDLIIWPETAYPETFIGQKSVVADVFRNIEYVTQSEILIGGYDQDPSANPMDFYETIFNASILISDGKVKTSYHKNILIPFGETLPFGPLNREIVKIVPAVSLFARGSGTPMMETKNHLRFVTPICYEILESNYMRNLLNEWKGNHFIVNHTNDSWYGDTAEPHQHLFLSKWRALEFNLPIVRSTNTGISSVIFQDGSESRRLGVGEEGSLDVRVPIGQDSETIYQLYGALPLLGLFVFLSIIIWIKTKSGQIKKS